MTWNALWRNLLPGDKYMYNVLGSKFKYIILQIALLQKKKHPCIITLKSVHPRYKGIYFLP